MLFNPLFTLHDDIFAKKKQTADFMKKTILLCMLFITCLTTTGQTVKVGTYNLRYDNPGDVKQGNSWTRRGSVICSIIEYEHPAIIGMQEVLHNQLEDLNNHLTDYEYIGVGREDGKTSGEYAPIFYNKEKVELIEKGHFWLSQTPHKPSIGWDAACTRICTWGKFRIKESGKPVFFFNFHADHVGILARRKAAEMITDSIKAKAGECTAILTGDFNVDQYNEIYSIFTSSGLLKDSFTAAKKRLATNGTFNGFDSRKHTDSRIDHVMVTKNTNVEKTGILTYAYWTYDCHAEKEKGKDAPEEISLTPQTLRFPSDHFPVMVTLNL